MPGVVPYLVFRRSTTSDVVWKQVELTRDVTLLGRREPPQDTPDFVDLQDRTLASREQARIIQRADAGQPEYVLENGSANLSIRLYAQVLRFRETALLQHGYQFRIPDLPAPHPYLLVTFGLREESGLEWTRPMFSFQIHHATRQVWVFGREMRTLTPQEYALLHYLYHFHDETCTYADIIAQLWKPDARRAPGDDMAIKRERLRVILTELRAKLRAASGGVDFIETVGRGEDGGLRLCP
jgi:hypothetical protein